MNPLSLVKTPRVRFCLRVFGDWGIMHNTTTSVTRFGFTLLVSALLGAGMLSTASVWATTEGAKTADVEEVPDVVDPVEAAKALAAGVPPSGALPKDDTPTSRQVANNTTMSSPTATNNAKSADNQDDPIAAIAREAEKETPPSEANATQAPQDEVTKAGTANTQSPEGGAPTSASPTASSTADTSSKPRQPESAAVAEVGPLAIPVDASGRRVEVDESHPTQAVKDAGEWTDEVKAKIAPKTVPNIEGVPAFLGITPYVTTKQDIETRFQGKTHWYESAPFGPGHTITGEDFGLGVNYLLIRYTADNLVSDMYLQIPKDKEASARAEIQKRVKEMDPQGLWVKSGEGSAWRNPVAELELSPDPDGTLTLLYGAVARQPWETRRWLDADPENRYPRFSGLLIGHTSVDELVLAMRSREGCHVGKPSVFPNGGFVITLEGNCFGLPQEKESDAWFDADSHRLTRLIIKTQANAEALEPVEAALARRYVATGTPGEFRTAEAPARNIWMPRVSVSPSEGRLEFDVPIDGLTSAATAWEALVKADAARRAEAKRIDKLFE
ncbi:MAG: hypothetical protein SOR95_06485 [Sutterella sp.]|nr:hypothetical protein [Sutterella sp.]